MHFDIHRARPFRADRLEALAHRVAATLSIDGGSAPLVPAKAHQRPRSTTTDVDHGLHSPDLLDVKSILLGRGVNAFNSERLLITKARRRIASSWLESHRSEPPGGGGMGRGRRGGGAVSYTKHGEKRKCLSPPNYASIQDKPNLSRASQVLSAGVNCTVMVDENCTLGPSRRRPN